MEKMGTHAFRYAYGALRIYLRRAYQSRSLIRTVGRNQHRRHRRNVWWSGRHYWSSRGFQARNAIQLEHGSLPRSRTHRKTMASLACARGTLSISADIPPRLLSRVVRVANKGRMNARLRSRAASTAEALQARTGGLESVGITRAVSR